MDEARTDGWEEWGKHVLKEQERQNDCIAYLTEQIASMRVDVAMLKVKAGLYGGLVGVVTAGIPTIIMLLKK